MDLVGAGLQDKVVHTGLHPPEFGGHTIGQDLEFFERFHGKSLTGDVAGYVSSDRGAIPKHIERITVAADNMGPGRTGNRAHHTW